MVSSLLLRPNGRFFGATKSAHTHTHTHVYIYTQGLCEKGC